jgi:RimJ/RimL family protein N-acetyltransferase
MFPDLTLQGRHVRLEPLSLAHVSALCAAAGGPRETYRLTFVPEGEKAMRRYVEEAVALRAGGAAVPFATVRVADARVVGSTRFGNLEYWRWPQGARSAPQPPDAVEIGWTWLAADAQRTALNTEAKLLMLEYAFEQLGVRRVEFKTDAQNARSSAALAALPAQFEGVFRKHVVLADGSPRDSAYYSVIDDEWPEVRANLERRLALSGAARRTG